MYPPLTIDVAFARIKLVEKRVSVMTYTPWGIRQRLASFQRYCSIEDLIPALIAAQRAQFTVNSVRNETRTLLTAATSRAIHLAESERLPEGLYVNVTTGTVADLLDKIALSLDFGERYVSEQQEAGFASGSGQRF